MFGSQKHVCLQNGSIHLFLIANKKLLLLNFIMLVDDLESSKIHTSYSTLSMIQIHVKYSIFHIFMQRLLGGMCILFHITCGLHFFVFMDRLCLCHCFFIINVLHKLFLVVVEVEHFRCFHAGLII